jgi:cytochrome c-type protein NapB
MKSLVMITVSLLIATAALAGRVYAEQPTSLRGVEMLNESSKVPEMKHYQKDGMVITREYVQQPPLIPHKIEGYQITAKYNKCLTCHSWNNYKQSGATKISQTHFEDREKNVLANVSARRYFCVQCHVPQATTKPLVENTFKPIDAISGQ